MTGRSAAVFVMPQEGHFHGLAPLVGDLAASGVTPHVFTDRRFADHVEAAGARFVDMFAGRPLEAADGESFPDPCRFVTFAGDHGEEIVEEARALRPSLVVYDQHAVIGQVVGGGLGVPYVCVSPAHNVSAAELPRLLATLPRVDVSARCRRAVEVLRERHGIGDASPFSFVTGRSPFLNIYGEPAMYLTADQRANLEPVAFYGCLPSTEEIRARRAPGPSHFDADDGRLKVYVCFGTVVWRYWPARALEAMSVISQALGRMPDVSAVISMGGADVGAEALEALARPNVSVTGYVDQWRLLGEADAFVTHNGLKSTHEAIFHRVPMISCPFFWDQPALAEACRRLGLAIPLASPPGEGLTAVDVEAAVRELCLHREQLGDRLADARDREVELIKSRGAVVRRITDLVRD